MRHIHTLLALSYAMLASQGMSFCKRYLALRAFEGKLSAVIETMNIAERDLRSLEVPTNMLLNNSECIAVFERHRDSHRTAVESFAVANIFIPSLHYQLSVFYYEHEFLPPSQALAERRALVILTIGEIANRLIDTSEHCKNHRYCSSQSTSPPAETPIERWHWCDNRTAPILKSLDKVMILIME